jgi:hypothetical protein
MKRLFLTLCLAFFIADVSFGQSFKEDVDTLNNSYNSWYIANAPELSKKLPLDVSTATSSQLEDATYANSIERKQISEVIKERNLYAQKIVIAIKKYVKDISAANSLAKNYQKLIAQSNEKLEQVKEGKLSFGAYIQQRQILLSEFDKLNASINKLNHIE